MLIKSLEFVQKNILTVSRRFTLQFFGCTGAPSHSIIYHLTVHNKFIWIKTRGIQNSFLSLPINISIYSY